MKHWTKMGQIANCCKQARNRKKGKITEITLIKIFTKF